MLLQWTSAFADFLIAHIGAPYTESLPLAEEGKHRDAQKLPVILVFLLPAFQGQAVHLRPIVVHNCMSADCIVVCLVDIVKRCNSVKIIIGIFRDKGLV